MKSIPVRVPMPAYRALQRFCEEKGKKHSETIQKALFAYFSDIGYSLEIDPRAEEPLQTETG